jgi:putative ABC transport system substrate-binding protein
MTASSQQLPVSSKKTGANSMLRRIVVCLPLTLFLFTVAQAQHPMKVHRIGYLAALDRVREFDRSDGIRTALREVGYIEGQNVVTEYQYTDGRMDRLPELAANLVRLKVDVILAAGGDPWIRAAKNATKTIPIIVTGQGSNPVEQARWKALPVPAATLPALQAIREN